MSNTYPESNEDRDKRLRREKFEALTRPLIEFLNGNYNPHTTVHITVDSAELSEGLIGFHTNDYIPD